MLGSIVPPGPAPNEIFIRKARRRTRAHPSDALACSKVTRWGSQQNAVAVGLDAQPNESRLSCGALKKESSFLRIYARRQLQALVRRRLHREAFARLLNSRHTLTQ